MFWNLAVIRGIYGFVGALGSIYERYFDTELFAKDLVFGKTNSSLFWCLLHQGFFVFEWGALCYFDVRFRTFSKGLHTHHMVAIVGYNAVLYFDQGHYTANSAFVLEFSTPFSCICYCLLKADMAKSLAWRVNQLALIHVFHLRSVIECLMMYETYLNWGDFCKLPVIMNAANLAGLISVGLFLTPYWTFRKTEQLFKPQDWNNAEEEERRRRRSGEEKKAKCAASNGAVLKKED